MDTEFDETPYIDGHGDVAAPTISLISIGIVADDGREYYAESRDFNEAGCNPWVKEKVLPLLGPRAQRKPNGLIGREILQFVGRDQNPEFWAYFADYDWVVFCWLFGSMIELPEHFPQLCMDLQQWSIQSGMRFKDRPKKPEGQHNALVDARWNKKFYAALAKESEA